MAHRAGGTTRDHALRIGLDAVAGAHRPPDEGESELLGGPRDTRVRLSHRRSEEARSLTRGRGESFDRPRQIGAHLGERSERERAIVTIPVNAEQVPPLYDFAQDLGMAAAFLANREERGLGARPIEHVENGTGVPGMGTVVERQGDPFGSLRTPPDDVGEHLEGRTQNAEGDEPGIGDKSRARHPKGDRRTQ